MLKQRGHCEISSAVERYPSKLDVRSSNLLFRFSRITLLNLFHNSSAVEPPTVNRLVPGSNPGCGVAICAGADNPECRGEIEGKPLLYP